MNDKQRIAEMTVNLFLSRGRKIEDSIAIYWANKLAGCAMAKLEKAFLAVEESDEKFPSTFDIQKLADAKVIESQLPYNPVAYFQKSHGVVA